MPGVSGVIVMVLPKFWLSIPAPNIAVVLASAKTRASKTGVRNFPNFFILFLLTFLLLTRKYETKNILYEKLTGVRNSLRLSEKEEIRENVLAGMAYAKEHGTKSGLPVGRPRVDISFTKHFKGGGWTTINQDTVDKTLDISINKHFSIEHIGRPANLVGQPIN
jgi:hypothetical protein